MKKLLIICLLFTGCNGLNRLVNGHDAPRTPVGLPVVYTVTGITSIDFQMIQPVRVAGSAITVEIKEIGHDTFRSLNQYEYGTTEEGVGRGGVWFKHKVLGDGKTFLEVLPQCSAPVGTYYKITSTLNE